MRLRGSFSKSRCMRSARLAERWAGSFSGCVFIFLNISSRFWVEKGGMPVSISYMMMPKLYTSAAVVALGRSLSYTWRWAHALGGG